MRTVALSFFCLLWLTCNCYAQQPCDSLYAKEDKAWKAYNDKGNVGLIIFDVPPCVVFGKEKLTNYTDNKDKVGAVMYRVRIDSLGHPSCSQFSYTNNKLLVAEANSILETLKFSPALQHGKGIVSTMYVTVRFYNRKSQKRNRS